MLTIKPLKSFLTAIAGSPSENLATNSISPLSLTLVYGLYYLWKLVYGLSLSIYD